MREKKNAHRDFVGKPQGKKPVARHTRDKWKHNIKMDQRNLMGCYELDSSGSSFGPVMGSCEHGTEASGSTKFLNRQATGGFSRRTKQHS
jgi:hypothetical protein